MTREDEAKAVLDRHGLVFANGTLAYRANVGTGDAAVAAMLEYGQQRAHAEAAAMRERAAKLCDERGAEEQKGFGLTRAAQNYFRARDAIRALPATGEVGRG